jgi:hypothetical protein
MPASQDGAPPPAAELAGRALRNNRADVLRRRCCLKATPASLRCVAFLQHGGNVRREAPKTRHGAPGRLDFSNWPTGRTPARRLHLEHRQQQASPGVASPGSFSQFAKSPQAEITTKCAVGRG